MADSLATELIDAYNNTGSVVKKREETHKMGPSKPSICSPSLVISLFFNER